MRIKRADAVKDLVAGHAPQIAGAVLGGLALRAIQKAGSKPSRERPGLTRQQAEMYDYRDNEKALHDSMRGQGRSPSGTQEVKLVMQEAMADLSDVFARHPDVARKVVTGTGAMAGWKVTGAVLPVIKRALGK